MSESIARKAQKQRERYSDTGITDLEALYAVKAELDMMQAELKEAEAEYRLAKRLMWRHSTNKDEWLFYLGAQMKMIELREEIECLEPEIEALAAFYIEGVINVGGACPGGA